jgi:hypothetical protein
MQTEPLVLPVAPRPEDALSPVFRSATAHRCFLATERNHEAPLTPAGYQLNYFRTYRFLFEEPVSELRLVGYPNNVIRVQDTHGAATKHDRRYRFVSFHVTIDGLWGKIKHQGADPHILELEVTLEKEGRKTALSFPVILQQSFSTKLIIFLVLSALLTIALEIVTRSIWGWRWQEIFSGKTWLIGFGFAALAPAKNLVSQLVTKYLRARELEKAFRQRWKTAKNSQ